MVPKNLATCCQHVFAQKLLNFVPEKVSFAKIFIFGFHSEKNVCFVLNTLHLADAIPNAFSIVRRAREMR